MTGLDIRPLTPHLGAEVRGVDLGSLDDATADAVAKAWLDWKVLVFRDQDLTREQHKSFGRRFGDLHRHPVQREAKRQSHYGDDEEILVVHTTGRSKFTAGNGWHSDVTCDAVPPMGSMLYVTRTPPDGGGDTLFADMYLAHDRLSPVMQDFLGGLVAVHDGRIPYTGNYGITPDEGRQFPRHEHPVVTVHPDTGGRVLFVNPGFTSHIVGMERWESRALLDALHQQVATTPSLHCRVSWEPGTLTFWDNRCVQHHSVWDYFPEERYGERVSVIDGRRPVGVGGRTGDEMVQVVE